MKNAIELIADERLRQVEKEGYTFEHDDMHTSFELSSAAGCFIANAQNKYFNYHTHSDDCGYSTRFQVREFETDEWYEAWPFADYDGREKSDVITSLVKAGALIVAEIERLQRLEE